MVDPRPDGELPLAYLGHAELGREPVGIGHEPRHGHGVPLHVGRATPAPLARDRPRLDLPVEQLGADDIVPVTEDDRRRVHRLAFGPFDRVARAIDRRLDVVDDDTHGLVGRIAARQHASLDARTAMAGNRVAVKHTRARSAVLDARSSGVLLHVTSLPDGRLGGEAYRFVDWLAAAGQRCWQVLPLGPPDRYDSPYSSTSAFAAWSGLLAEPDASVSADEIEAFVASHPYWSAEWAAFAGPGAIADQVR